LPFIRLAGILVPSIEAISARVMIRSHFRHRFALVGQYCGEKGGTNNNIGRPLRKSCSLTDAKQHVKLQVDVCN
jgi:hypothetical protein